MSALESMGTFGPFTLLEQVGRGGFGHVFRVVDPRSKAPLALKLLKEDAQPSEISSFIREYTFLEEHRAPGLVQVFDLFNVEGRWAYTMELLLGSTLSEHKGQHTPMELENRLRQSLEALCLIHDRGFIHGDLRPENLFQSKDLENNPRLTLLDFGLSRPSGRESWVGAPLWAAPELLVGEKGVFQSDLYSLGSVFYALACGQPPFKECDIPTLIKAKLTGAQSPLPPDSHNIMALIERLMSPALEARPQDAWDALSALNDCFPEQNNASQSHLPTLKCMGRDNNVATLLSKWEGTPRQHQWVSVVEGIPGSGRTRFLKTLALGLAKSGKRHTFAAGPWGQLPYEVVPHLLPLEIWQNERFCLELGEKFPMAGRQIGFSQAAPQGPLESTDLLTDIVALLTTCLKRYNYPIFIDDVQDLDPDSLQVLLRLGTATSMKVGDGVITLSIDSTSLNKSPISALLEGLQEDDDLNVRLEMQPLSTTHIQGILDSAFGAIQGDDGLAKLLKHLSGGNPLLLEGQMRSLLASGCIFRVGQNFAIDPDEMLAVRTLPPGDIGTLFLQRLAVLTPQAREILNVAALLGPDLSFSALETVALLPLGDGAAQALKSLHQRGLLIPQGQRYNLEPPRLSQWLIAALTDQKRLDLRGHIGQCLISDLDMAKTAATARVTEHLLAAGDIRGIALAMAVATTWQAGLNFAPARLMLRSALKVAEQSGQDSFHIHNALAACAKHLGDFPEAAKSLEGILPAYRRATPVSDLNIRQEAARFFLDFGEVLGRAGRWKEGQGALRRAHTLFGSDILGSEEMALAKEKALLRRYQGDPRGAEHILKSCLINQGILPMDTPGNANALQFPTDTPQLRLALELVQNLSASAYLLGQMEEAKQWAKAALLKSIPTWDGQKALALEEGPLGEVAANLCLLLSTCYSATGDFDSAANLCQSTINFYESTGRSHAAARCYNNLGIFRLQQGRWREATELWERFRRVCDRTQAKADLASVLNNLGSAYREYGRLPQAKRRLEQSLVLARQTGYRALEGMVLGNLGEVAFRQGDLGRAKTHYKESLTLAQEVGAGDNEVEAKRRIIEWMEAEEITGIPALAQVAIKQAQELGIPVEEGILLGCLGQALVKNGQESLGFKHLKAGSVLLNNLRADLPLARHRVREVKAYCAAKRWVQMDQAVLSAENTFVRLGAQWDLDHLQQLVKKIDELAPGVGGSRKNLQLLLDVNKNFSQVLDLQALLQEILSQSLKVTTAQRGFIILLDEDGKPTFKAAKHMNQEEVEGTEQDVSSTVIREVIETRKAKSVTNIDDDHALRNQESVVKIGLRSVMAAPMICRGQLLGVIYVDSQQATSQLLLSPNVRLFEALGEAAGVAVENAKLYGDLKRKTELMQFMAHEFRTPLTGILNFAELLLDDDKTPPHEREAFLTIIRDQGRRLSGMVSSILDLAEMKGKTIGWSMTLFDMKTIAEETTKSLAPLAQKKNLSLKVCARENTPSAYGNGDRIMQVLTNLLSNAFKFTPHSGSVTIFISEEAIPKESQSKLYVAPSDAWSHRLPLEGRNLSETRCILVSVKDSGRGIEPEALGSIFDKFSQEGSVKDRRKGTGLGLAIAREIVDYHGGRIWAENRPEGGAALSFYIPLLEDETA